MRIPSFFSLLDARPGVEWTPEEFERVVAWWSEREQEKLVWYCVARFIGPDAIREDVEEVWLDFYSTLIARARVSYRPVGVSYCTYLLDVCLKNHCLYQGDRIRRHRKREVSREGDTELPALLELQRDSDNGEADPFRRAWQEAFLAALNAALNSGQIKSRHREAFLLRHRDQLSFPEIAVALDVSEGTVRMWVYRTAAPIAAHLRAQGWSE